MTYETLMAHSGLTGWLRDARFNALEARPGMEEAIQAAKDFAGLPLSGDTLILSGDYGCGKTHIAASVCGYLIRRLVRVRLLNCDQYLKAVKDSWGKNGGERPAPPAGDVPLLVMDELAPNNEMLHGSLQSELYDIVNPRYQAGLPMLVTTNQRTPSALGDVIGGRLLDRLLHRARWVDITASSYRMREYSERKRG